MIFKIYSPYCLMKASQSANTHCNLSVDRWYFDILNISFWKTIPIRHLNCYLRQNSRLIEIFLMYGVFNVGELYDFCEEWNFLHFFTDSIYVDICNFWVFSSFAFYYHFYAFSFSLFLISLYIALENILTSIFKVIEPLSIYVDIWISY